MAGQPIGPGELLTVAGGALQVELLPSVGARFHRLRAFGHDLLRTPHDLAEHLRDPFFWGAYVMAPWCNRIAVGSQKVDGHLVELAPNFPDGSAIHGQVYRAPWQVQPDGTLSVEGGGSGWPWSYRATLRVSIVGTELRIALALRNLSTSTMPAGIGLHPWFRRPVEISINASSALPSNTDASAALTAVTARLDLRVPGPMPDDLDATWRPDRDPAATLHWPDRGLTARLTVRSNTDAYIVAASPRTLDAVAVEPQTHAPFGLSRFLDGRPGRLHPLAPGATLRLEIILAFDQLGSP